jgi:hypothetical protein
MNQKQTWIFPVIVIALTLIFVLGSLLAELFKPQDLTQSIFFFVFMLLYIALTFVMLLIFFIFPIWCAIFTYRRGNVGLAKTIFGLMASVIFTPLAHLLAIIVWFFLRNTSVINPVSPREAVRDIAETPPISTIFIILFVVLTAASILGGVIVCGALFLNYKILLALLPGPKRIHTTSKVSRSTSAGSYKSSGSSWQADDNDDKLDAQQEALWAVESERDDEDDDRGEGSMWDGWLVKH